MASVAYKQPLSAGRTLTPHTVNEKFYALIKRQVCKYGSAIWKRTSGFQNTFLFNVFSGLIAL